MPIYEFKCLKCGEFMEMLFMNSDEKMELKCSKCDSEELERVLSVGSHSMGDGAQGKPQTGAQSRSCSGGSCTTYTIPGAS